MRGDKSKNWYLSPLDKNSRTVKKIEGWADGKRKQYSCKHKPLFMFIDMDHVIVDTLHLFLRIADVLIARLIQDLKLLDHLLSDKNIPNGVFDRNKYTHKAQYEKVLQELKISFQV